MGVEKQTNSICVQPKVCFNIRFIFRFVGRWIDWPMPYFFDLKGKIMKSYVPLRVAVVFVCFEEELARRLFLSFKKRPWIYTFYLLRRYNRHNSKILCGSFHDFTCKAGWIIYSAGWYVPTKTILICQCKQGGN